MNMTFSEQFKSDVLLIWRTNGWVLMTVFTAFMLMPVADLPALHSAKKPPLLTLGYLSMGGIASTLFGQSFFGAEYGFWTARFLTKEPLKDFFWKRIGTVMSIYAIVTAISTGLTFTIRPELWQEAMGVFYVGMTLFGAASTFLFIIYSSAIRPIPFERMWLRINAFKAQGFKWQNLILSFVWAGVVMAVGYTFLVLEPQIWLIGVVVLSGLCCFFAVWSTEFLTRYLCRRRFNVMQELLQTDK